MATKTNKTNTAKAMRASEMFVLRAPRITEKSSMLSEQKNIYVFNVPINATKNQVLHAVRAQYKVSPIKINMVKIRSKKVTVRNKVGHTNRGKKAYIFLKKGENIKLA